MNNISKKIVTFVGAVVLIGIVVSGFMATKYMTKKIEQDERSSLLLRATMVAALIDTDKLNSLHGTETDMTTPEYLNIKRALEKANAINTDTRFVYIIGQKDGVQKFYVDAEASSSPDFSPAGQIYSDATASDMANVESHIAYSKGPYTDNWGTWFTAYAPAASVNGTDFEIGMDVAAEKILLRMSIVREATIIIFSLIFLALLAVFVLLRASVGNVARKDISIY